MKQIVKTPKMTARLAQITGDPAAVDGLAVYEAIAFNNTPIRKKHPIYEGAVADLGLLSAMSDAVNADPRPVQIMHDSSVLPVGKVFAGGLNRNDAGFTELRTLFYVPKTDTTSINQLDSAVVDEVSVSVLSQHVLCSACGWDYLGDDATFDNIYQGVCLNGHVLRQDGVHAQLVGLDTWFEMSLVGRGGAVNAKIVPPSASKLTERLAASGITPQMLVLNSSIQKEIPAVAGETDLKLLETTNAALVDARVKLGTTEAENVTLTATVVELTAKLKTVSDELDAAKKLDAVKVAADLVLANAETKKAVEFLKAIAMKGLIATGKKDAAAPDTIDALVASINETQSTLTALLTPGGKAAGASTDDKVAAPRDLSAFTTRKQ